MVKHLLPRGIELLTIPSKKSLLGQRHHLFGRNQLAARALEAKRRLLRLLLQLRKLNIGIDLGLLRIKAGSSY